MDINGQATFGSNAAEFFKGCCAIGHGTFKMRNTAHNIKAHIERTIDQLNRAWRAVITVLREGHELEVNIRLHLFANFDHRGCSEQTRIANIDMAADGKQTLADRQIAIAQSALDHGFNG